MIPFVFSDPRIAALTLAIREQRIVRLRAHHDSAETVHPTGLELSSNGWSLLTEADTVPEAHWGDINISAHRF